MCYHPITLPNPRLKAVDPDGLRRFRTFKDRLLLEVPCGHCQECRDDKKNQLYTRMYFEFMDNVEHDGLTFFDTFTYSEDTVPRFHGLKCFNKQHYMDFMKRLRTNITRDLQKLHPHSGIKFSDLNIRVVWSSEYGSKTHRPHYHAVFFVRHDKCKITSWFFKKNIKKSWTYGFTDKRSPFDLSVNRLDALKYATKYIHKDDNFLYCLNDQKDSKEFLDWFHTSYFDLYGKKYSKASVGFSDLRSLIYAQHDDVALQYNFEGKYIVPFHAHSQGLGACIIDRVPLDDLLSDKIRIPFDNRDLPYKTPDYIVRKFFMTYDKLTKCYEPKDSYNLLYFNRMKKNLESVPVHMTNVFDNLNSLPMSVQSTLAERCHSVESLTFDSLKDVQNRFTLLLGSRTLSDLAYYRLFYKDRYVDEVPDVLPSLDDTLDHYYFNLEMRESPSESISYADTRPLKYNDLPMYSHFDKLLEYFHIFTVFFNDAKEVQAKLRQTRDNLASFAYHTNLQDHVA